MAAIERREDLSSDPNSLRKQESIRIVNSILTKGLLSTEAQKSSGDSPFRSALNLDSSDLGWVFGCWVMPPSQEVREEGRGTTNATYYAEVAGTSRRFNVQIGDGEKLARGVVEDALYGDFSKYSVLPVIAERAFEHIEETRRFIPKEELENRFAHSLLVVIPLSDLEDEIDVSHDELKFGQVGLKSSVLPSKFSAILMGEQVGAEFAQGSHAAGIPVKAVGSVSREMRERQFMVPDYESEIMKMLKEMDAPLFIHGVRLPTRQDMETPKKEPMRFIQDYGDGY